MRNRHPCLNDPIPLDAEGESPLPSIAHEKVLRLMEEAAATQSDWRPPPFPPEVYARILGIPIQIAPELREWDALLVPTDGSYRILCRADVTPGRRRFSLAHELSHLFFEAATEDRLFMRARKADDYYLTETDRRLERACDALAAELLMPREWFARAVAERGFTAAAVPHLAGDYAVSLEAAALRAVDVGEGPCAVGFFEFAPRPSCRVPAAPREGGTKRGLSRACAGAADAGTRPVGAPDAPCEMAYRARRVFRSAGFPFHFPEGKSVPRASVIHAASLQRQELGSVEVFELGGRRERLRVTAYPLHREEVIDEPPTVCATFLRE
jgi:hypothetical protein